MLELRARRAARSPWLTRLARVGLVSKGASYALVGVLAIGVAVGHGGQTTTRQGALRALAHHGWGKVVLVLLAVGFAGYALWRFADAFLDRRGEGDDAKGLAQRAGEAARGGIYVFLLVSAILILTGSGGGGGGTEKTQRTTAGVLGWPGGRWLVLAAGLAIAGASIWNFYRGISGKFEEKLRVSGDAETASRWLGAIGMSARGVVFGLIAWFLIKAAVQYDPNEAVSLDGALARLAHHAYGTALLGVVAAGLVAYSVYCLFEARYRDV